MITSIRAYKDPDPSLNSVVLKQTHPTWDNTRHLDIYGEIVRVCEDLLLLSPGHAVAGI